jgi:hypothetical protein
LAHYKFISIIGFTSNMGRLTHISHGAIQAWINKVTTSAGIPQGVGDSFTTHTYCRGGA